MMELVMHTEKNDTVSHTEKTGMLRLMVEIDVGGMSADVIDKVTCSFDDLQLEQVDLKCIHALNKLHLHDIRIVPNRHEVDQYIHIIKEQWKSQVEFMMRSSPKEIKEDLFISCVENGILQDSFEPSNYNTNVANALREPFVVNQDPGKNSSQSPPQINHHCCYECGDPLEDIFCHQCTCELCGNGAHYGYNCPPKVSIIPDPEPFNNQTIKVLPPTVPSFDSTGYSEDGNSFTYDSTSILVHDYPNVFDPPSQLPFYSCEFCGNYARCCPYCTPQVPFIYQEPYYTFAITPNELDNSLSMGDEHLDTVPTMESNEFIKSSVENLVPNPSVSEDFYSVDDQSIYDEDILKKTYLNPLFDEEIISMEIDPHHFNAKSDLIESLLNHDSSIISSSSKIDSLFDEFAGELTLLKSIPLGINETDCDPKEETHFIKRLLYDNSTPHPPKEFNSENSDGAIESFSSSHIPPNGEALRKCILNGPYKPTTVLVQVVEATEDSPTVPEHTAIETPTNMSPENKAHFLAEKEAIHLILTGIGDDIYSTVDACQTSQEMWEAIERLQQGESLNIQDMKTNLFWEFGKFTSHDGESMESYYTRFYKLMNKTINNNLIVTTMQQYQNEVNELRAEKLARNANPLALVATAQASQDQYYQSSRSRRSSVPSPKPSIPSRSHTSTRHKDKEIAKPITPTSETASKEDSDPEQAQRDKDIALTIGNMDILRRNTKSWKELRTLLDTDEEVDEQELEAHYSYMAKIQEVPTVDSGTDSEPVEQVQNKAGYNVFPNHLQHSEQSEYVSNTCLVETDDSNVTLDSPDMCEDDIQNEQNGVESDDEHVALANLIANLKLVVDENKKTQNQLKKANTTLAQEMKQCKPILVETSKSLGESISVRDSFLVALQTKQAEFEKFKAFNDRTVPTYNGRPTFANPRYLKQDQSEVPCLYAFPYDQNTHANRLILDGEETLALERESRSKLNTDSVRPYDYTKLNSLYEIFKPPTQEYETQLAYSDSLKFVHELKQEMHADLMYVESLKKEIDELESDKAEFSDMYDVIFKKVHIELLQRFAKVEKHSISLEIALQNCKEQVKNDTVWNEKASNGFRKERELYFEIQDLNAQLQDKNIAISELKKLIEHGKGKSMDTKFDKPSVVRQPNAQRIPKPSVLRKPTPFLDSLDRRYFPKTKSVPKANVSEGMYRIDNRTAHTKVPQLPQTVRNTNPRVSTSIRVNHKPNVSRPQLKRNQSRDKVLPNNSQVKAKKTQLEVHHRIPSVSNKIKSVTACKDSLNSKTLNAKAVCATCNKCLVNSNHFACVTKMLNDVHARTKKPNVVPISTRNPKVKRTNSVDSGWMKHMMGNLKLLCNFVEKFLGTVRFRNDQFAPILGYGDMVAFRKSICFPRDLQGNDLLNGEGGRVFVGGSGSGGVEQEVGKRWENVLAGKEGTCEQYLLFKRGRDGVLLGFWGLYMVSPWVNWGLTLLVPAS
nr:hypothetical protein [Tanacetum cinerariifolium]